MSHPYTDRFGYPVSSIEAARRMNAPKRRGYYNAQGRWVRLGTAKRTPPEKAPTERKPSS